MIAAATALSHPSYPDPCQFTFMLLYCPFPSFWFFAFAHLFASRSSVGRRTTDRPRPTFTACESIQRQRTTVTDTATYTGDSSILAVPPRKSEARRLFPSGRWCYSGVVAGSSLFFFSSLHLPCATGKGGLLQKKKHTQVDVRSLLGRQEKKRRLGRRSEAGVNQTKPPGS